MITEIFERGPIKPLSEDNFMDYLMAQRAGEKWVYQNFTVNYDLSAIVSSLKNGDLRAVCDGSFDPGYGTAGWCLEGERNIIRGVNIVPIGNTILDTIRCELAGIYTILQIVQCMGQFFHITDDAIDVGSDYKSSINRILLSTNKIPLYYTNDSHLDMINAITNICR